MKDHQLALLDRNQYPDRGVAVSIGVKLMSGDGSTTTKDKMQLALDQPSRTGL